MSCVTTDRMEQAVLYLCSTDEQYASSRARYNGLKEQAKVVKAMAFLRSISTSQTQKEQDSLSSPTYRDHIRKMEEAEYEYLLIQTRRETELTIIDCWRSLNSAKSKGML
jgi:hypothetical protein